MKNKEQIAKIWDVLDSLNVDVLHNKQAIIKLENGREKPQLKPLDQSAFDHPYVDDRFKYVALNADSQAVFFESKPVISNCLDIWVVHTGSVMPMLKGYDASNWQTSLIEREINELTGSELCKAMLARGDTRIMCLVSDEGSRDDLTHVIRVYEDGRFHTKANSWKYAVPINNHGEPLTSKDVGLQ